ncbi:hypothetical protein [Micromonospora sp. NPDC005367]|uniref:hypothetical protein n=1 Tax=Micromonospora sp. NPDC005367 TaxID=3155590 RepID=UPI0033ADBABD
MTIAPACDRRPYCDGRPTERVGRPSAYARVAGRSGRCRGARVWGESLMRVVLAAVAVALVAGVGRRRNAIHR